MTNDAARFIEKTTRRGERVGPLIFVAYGEKMEADAKIAFAGTGVQVIRAPMLKWSDDAEVERW